jgi:plastocyanin
VLSIASIFGLSAGSAHASVLLDETKLIGLPSVAAPSEYSFTATTAQALTLTITDFQVPAAFSSLQVAVTLGDALVGSATVDPTTHVATVAIPAAAGNYTVNVIGTPNAVQGFGSFGVCVAPATSASSCIAADSFAGNLLTPSTSSSDLASTLNTYFVSTVTGTYTVTITDDAFPVALQSISGGIADGSTPIAPLAAGTNQVSLTGGTTYTLIVGALANAAVTAGLYGIHIVDPTGAVVFDRTLPVGSMPAPTIVDNPAAQALTLRLTDLGYPDTLTSLGVDITEGSSSLARLTASGTVASSAAPKGAIDIWQYAVAGAKPGAYSLNLSGGTGAVLSTTEVVGTGNSSTAQSFAFVVTLPAPGTYNLAVNDFQFPATFQTLTATVAQNGAALTQNASGDFTAAQGVAIVLVNAVPPVKGNGIFGVTVQGTGASPQTYLDQTQAVGGVFQSQTVNLGTSGGYEVTLADLGFPATFQDLAAVVSRGGKMLGNVTAQGMSSFSATPGTYVVSLVATPSSQNYGLYSLRVSSSPPTVTFASSAAAVTIGGTVTLTWNSQNTTACTGSGGTGWTGPQMTNGTLAVTVSGTETLTLTCTGPGGSATQSVTVTAKAAPASSGGGGSVDLWLLAMLGTLLPVRASVIRRATAG